MLSHPARERICIVGIGNVLRGDDAFGPELVSRLSGSSLREGVVLIDASTTPENQLGPIARSRPDVVLLADAVHLGAAAGSMELLVTEEIVRSGLSTHDQSPRLFLERLASELGESVVILMLGAQPMSTRIGDSMTPELDAAVKRAAHELERVLSAEPDPPGATTGDHRAG